MNEWRDLAGKSGGALWHRLFRWVAAICLPLLLVSGCGAQDVVQFHLYQWTERPHWTGGGKKTCSVTFKILNNSGFEIANLAASLYFRDGYGETVKQVFLTENPLPDNTASGSGRTPPMFGACNEIEIIGIRDVLRCDMPGRSFDECRAMLTLKLPDERG